ncbi:bactericidal permeability-increasing protein [Anguilla anguilla]|uniref:bactericidal permeability-increasing protein n=1 Tax=Anguilla anguilla TaxID=7936 RepID=UPI0015B29B44|nr:bactericidal permeability-increasing protein [Anguilla anguilla]XP_035239220.1 bactericidal permeability-increasing protein [Anguilla anguilla]
MCRSLLLLLSLAACAMATNPAIKAVLTDKGLKFGTKVGTEWLQAQILKAQIPDMSGDVSLSILGSVHYTLSRMGVARLNMPLPSVVFSEGTGVQVDLTGFNMAVKGQWNTHYLFIRDGGTFRLGMFNVGVSLQLQVGSDENGHLSVSSVQCRSSIGAMDILFHGGASWVLQQFVTQFKHQIQSQVQEKICPTFERGIQGLESHLAAMNVSIPLYRVLLLDMPLTNSPAIQASDLSLDFKGEFYSAQCPKEPPFVSKKFQLPPQERFMLTLGVSEFCLNSAAFAYMSTGLLQINITDKMIPPHFPIHLNTSSFGQFVPQLPKLYPNMLMLFHVYASSTPLVSFLPDNATLLLSASAKAYAIKPNSSALIPLFRLDLSANIGGKFFVEDMMLKGSLMLNNFTLTLGASEVGTFSTLPLQKVLNVGITTMALPLLNAKLKHGLPIPAIKNVNLSNAVLKVNKGFVAVATDAAGSALEEGQL